MVAANIQGFPVKLPVTPLWVNDTVPVGLIGEAELSLTVAVHVVGVFVFTDEGAQITAMSVACAVFTVSAALPELVV